MRQITWFLSHPIQYFSPLLKALARQAGLSVYYYSDPAKGGKDKGFGIPVKWDTDLLGGYDYRFIRNLSSTNALNNHFFDVFNPGVAGVIRKKKGNVVIVNGWSYSSDLMVIFFSRLLGREVWLRAENPLSQELKKSRIKLALKKLFLKFFLFRFFINKWLFIGKENRAFFEFYGAASSDMIYTPYAVDNHFFSLKSDELKGKEKEIRDKLGLPRDKKIILFAGKYIPKKNPMDLLAAFRLLENDNYALVMVGEGRLRTVMEQYIRENQLKEVYLTGFVNQQEISFYYSVADVFVMCSGMGETWGLAVNEAMNFSKPVIVSDTCGCSADLVRHGENGFVFPEGDVKSLSDCINRLMKDDGFRFSAGSLSARIVQDYSIEKTVDQLCKNL